MPAPGIPEPSTALGTSRASPGSTGCVLTDLFGSSVRSLLSSSAHLFAHSRVWQKEQMLGCRGSLGGQAGTGLCSPGAVQPRLITLTRLFLVFTALLCIDLNCS